MKKRQRVSGKIIFLSVCLIIGSFIASVWLYSSKDHRNEDQMYAESHLSKPGMTGVSEDRQVDSGYLGDDRLDGFNSNKHQQLIKRLAGRMIFIADGGFDMGSKNGSFYEVPVHRVYIKSFELGEYEVTQQQWREIMGSNPSYNKNCDDCPVEKVSWNDVQDYIKKLNKLTGRNYRLPTETEWEYACRNGGQSQQYCGGSKRTKLSWNKENSNRSTHPVGEKSPNSLGLYDMTGNVWEWLQDCWNESYDGAPVNEEAWQTGDCEQRLLRGGSWDDDEPYDLRSTYRNSSDVDKRYFTFGFRLAHNQSL